jgi:TRAP-type C4-dicarboxylate transport system permease small subunit
MTATGAPAATPDTGPVRRRLARVHRLVEVAERAVGALLVGVVLVAVVLQAAARYLPVSGWVWTGELARYALVWLTFALAGYLTGRGEHIGLEIVDYLARGRLLTLVRRFADAVVAAIAAAFTVDAWNLVAASTDRVSPVLGIPLRWLYLVAVAGFALTTIRAGWAALYGRPTATPDDGWDGRPAEPPGAEPGSADAGGGR